MIPWSLLRIQAGPVKSMRRPFALVVAVLHLVLVWLLIAGERPMPHVQTDTRVYASLWIDPKVSEPQPPVSKKSRPSRPAVFPDPASGVASIVESFAESSSSLIPRPSAEAVAVPGITSAASPKVDVSMEAIAAASRAVGQSGDRQRKDFTAPPAPSSKPCVPGESSMEWNGKEDRRVTFSGPLPVIRLGKRCVVTIGMIGCSFGAAPEPNSHLLDDMRKPDRARSSVPDAHVCD
jgi:hypothetical protein